MKRISQFCNKCPVETCIVKYFDKGDQPLAINVAQGLSGAFATAVGGTKGLTDERIEEIRQEEIVSWDGAEEAQALEDHPELARAVYECEVRITVLGDCALHTTVQRA